MADSTYIKPIISTSLLQESDIPHVVNVINDAFMADAFFKHDQYKLRTNEGELNDSLLKQHTDQLVHVIGRCVSSSSSSSSSNRDEIVASVALTFEIQIIPILLSGEKYEGNTYVLNVNQCSDIEYIKNLLYSKKDEKFRGFDLIFSVQIFEVSVSSPFQGRGVGKQIVSSGEQFGKNILHKYSTILQKTLQQIQQSDLTFNIKYISKLEVLSAVRPELEPWYIKQGYSVIGQQEFSHKFICLPEYDFKSTMLEKIL